MGLLGTCSVEKMVFLIAFGHKHNRPHLETIAADKTNEVAAWELK